MYRVLTPPRGGMQFFGFLRYNLAPILRDAQFSSAESSRIALLCWMKRTGADCADTSGTVPLSLPTPHLRAVCAKSWQLIVKYDRAAALQHAKAISGCRLREDLVRRQAPDGCMFWFKHRGKFVKTMR